MLRIAINGYGRIGRAVLRAIFQNGLESRIRVEAINDLGNHATLAHLTRFDSTYGRYPGSVTLHEDMLQISGQSIRLLQEANARLLPGPNWAWIWCWSAAASSSSANRSSSTCRRARRGFWSATRWRAPS